MQPRSSTILMPFSITWILNTSSRWKHNSSPQGNIPHQWPVISLFTILPIIHRKFLNTKTQFLYFQQIPGRCVNNPPAPLLTTHLSHECHHPGVCPMVFKKAPQTLKNTQRKKWFRNHAELPLLVASLNGQSKHSDESLLAQKIIRSRCRNRSMVCSNGLPQLVKAFSFQPHQKIRSLHEKKWSILYAVYWKFLCFSTTIIPPILSCLIWNILNKWNSVLTWAHL